MRMLRGGLIGCGFFAGNHLNAWRDLDGAQIVAVCDRERAKAEQAAATFGIPAVYDDAAAMLASEDLDFVDIVTTVPSHRPLVELAAAHRVAAICQKPFASTMADAAAMVEACRRAGVPLMVHENFRWEAPLLAVARHLAAGDIGTPRWARFSFRHAYDVYSGQPYLLTEPRLAIMDVGVHLLDVARAIMGEATRIDCRTQRIDPRVTGEDSATMLLDHVDGAVSIVDLCFASIDEPDPFPQTIVRVEGTRGTITVDPGYRLNVIRPGKRETVDVEPPVPAWGAKPWHVVQDSVLNIQRHWIECLSTGREPATSGADNLKTLDLTFKAYDSAAAMQAVAVGDSGAAG